MKETKGGTSYGSLGDWAMSFLDCIFPTSHARAVGQGRRHWAFGHAAAMQFSGGQALPFRWFLCELERVRSMETSPERPHCSLPACFTSWAQRDPQKIRQSESSVGKQDDAPDPGPPPPRPTSIHLAVPFGGRGPSARWPAKAGRSEWPDRHGSMPHATRARHGRA